MTYLVQYYVLDLKFKYLIINFYFNIKMNCEALHSIILKLNNNDPNKIKTKHCKVHFINLCYEMYIEC